MDISDFNIVLRRHLHGIRIPRHSCTPADSIERLRTVIVNAGEGLALLVTYEGGGDGRITTSDDTHREVDLDGLDAVLSRFVGSVPRGQAIRVTVRDTLYTEAATVIPHA